MRVGFEKNPKLRSRSGKASMPRHLPSLIFDFHNCKCPIFSASVSEKPLSRQVERAPATREKRPVSRKKLKNLPLTSSHSKSERPGEFSNCVADIMRSKRQL